MAEGISIFFPAFNDEGSIGGLVGDALAVLAAVGEVELDDEQAEAVALLALVAGQRR